MQTDADLPDLVDHDNITINSEIHHAHSYKLEERDGKLHWLDGDCLERLRALCADTHDFCKEGKLAMARYALAKATHYRVDSLTFPHLHRGKPWSKHHQKFEDEMGAYLIQHQGEVGALVFEPYPDVYKAARKTAIEMWHEGMEVVGMLERGEELTDDLMIHVCRTCVQGIGDLWTTLAHELKI